MSSIKNALFVIHELTICLFLPSSRRSGVTKDPSNSQSFQISDLAL